MASNRRTAERALIACRHSHKYSPFGALIERLFQRLFPGWGWVSKGETQVNDSHAGIEAIRNRRSQLLRSGVRNLVITGIALKEDGTYQ
jgi:hypothetical protein